MPAFTTGKALPYAQPTDRLADGAEAIRKLAQSVDNMIQTAVISIPITAVNTGATVVWTFPIAFAAPPIIQLTLYGVTAANLDGGHRYSITVPPTATQATIGGYRTTGSGPFTVMVTAVGPVAVVT